MSKNKIVPIIVYLTSIVVVAVLGSIFVNIGMTWFDSLRKPMQWIPNFIIPIVWTIIYALFAIIGYLWIKNDGLSIGIIILLALNGILNVLWCLLFFTLNLTFVGLIAIVINLIFGILLIVNIYNKNKAYGYAVMIYPIWLSIATCLNLAMWILN